MIIKILGTGCPNCQKLEANTKQALEELNMEASVEKVTDMGKIMSYGIMSVPALVVDDKVLMAGIVADVMQIKNALLKNKTSSNCSCGCHC